MVVMAAANAGGLHVGLHLAEVFLGLGEISRCERLSERGDFLLDGIHAG